MASSRKDVSQLRSAIRHIERLAGEHSRICCRSITTAQCHTLLEIKAAETTTTTSLAHTLSLDPSTISRTVDSLVRSGHVARAENPEDRRSIELRLTDKGNRLADSVNKDANMYYAGVLSRIPVEKRDLVMSGLGALAEALAPPKDHRLPVGRLDDSEGTPVAKRHASGDRKSG